DVARPLSFRRALINHDCPAASAASLKNAAPRFSIIMTHAYDCPKFEAWLTPPRPARGTTFAKLQPPPAPGHDASHVHARVDHCIVHSPLHNAGRDGRRSQSRPVPRCVSGTARELHLHCNAGSTRIMQQMRRGPKQLRALAEELGWTRLPLTPKAEPNASSAPRKKATGIGRRARGHSAPEP